MVSEEQMKSNNQAVEAAKKDVAANIEKRSKEQQEISKKHAKESAVRKGLVETPKTDSKSS